MNPSGVMIKPEPLPPEPGLSSLPPRRDCPPVLRDLKTSIFTTDGLTASAAVVTALEYASSKNPSLVGRASSRAGLGASSRAGLGASSRAGFGASSRAGFGSSGASPHPFNTGLATPKLG